MAARLKQRMPTIHIIFILAIEAPYSTNLYLKQLYKYVKALSHFNVIRRSAIFLYWMF